MPGAQEQHCQGAFGLTVNTEFHTRTLTDDAYNFARGFSLNFDNIGGINFITVELNAPTSTSLSLRTFRFALSFALLHYLLAEFLAALISTRFVWTRSLQLRFTIAAWAVQLNRLKLLNDCWAAITRAWLLLLAYFLPAGCPFARPSCWAVHWQTLFVAPTDTDTLTDRQIHWLTGDAFDKSQ